MVITGGASGLGLEAARRYASVGMNVVIMDRGNFSLETAAHELRSLASFDDSIASFECNASDFPSIEKVRVQSLERFGKVQCRMNNAGFRLLVGASREGRDELETTLSLIFRG